MKSLALSLLLVSSLAMAERIPVIVFHAGSLSVPFAKIEAAFEAKYPRYDVVREAAGSRACARKITDLHKKADVMASADYTVVENLMMPDYARFVAQFATNAMVLAYTNRSRYHDEINGANWPRILLREGVKVGHSNPNLDPCGYRSVLTVMLAERHYDIPGFYDRLLGYGARYEPSRARRGRIVVRPKETDLLGLLEAGAIDYLFIYRSVAMQHGLRFVELPPQIDLSDPRYADLYARAAFQITGKRPGEWVTKRGAPMVYGVTIPQNATLPPHPEGARAFVRFLLGPEVRAIMQSSGQGVVDPPKILGDASILDR
ncbi:tungstate ABC transporter substrate-binding protein WtpA [Hydrogenimonas sp.]